MVGQEEYVCAWDEQACGCRYAVSQRAQVLGQALGLPICMAAFTFVGLAVSSATVTIFGHAITDPVQLLGRLGGPLPTCLGLLGQSCAAVPLCRWLPIVFRICRDRNAHESSPPPPPPRPLSPNLPRQLCKSGLALQLLKRPWRWSSALHVGRDGHDLPSQRTPCLFCEPGINSTPTTASLQLTASWYEDGWHCLVRLSEARPRHGVRIHQ